MPSPTYPSSLDVSAGQPTSIVQYNRLRADALRLGAPLADAVTQGSFFSSLCLGHIDHLPGIESPARLV